MSRPDFACKWLDRLLEDKKWKNKYSIPGKGHKIAKMTVIMMLENKILGGISYDSCSSDECEQYSWSFGWFAWPFMVYSLLILSLLLSIILLWLLKNNIWTSIICSFSSDVCFHLRLVHVLQNLLIVFFKMLFIFITISGFLDKLECSLAKGSSIFQLGMLSHVIGWVLNFTEFNSDAIFLQLHKLL